MAAGVLDQCPICRARLDGAGPCRRCRAELDALRRIADESAALAGAGHTHFSQSGRLRAALTLGTFAAVYVLWGSTYLAIAVAVQSIPPFLLIAVRSIAAGAILFGIALFQNSGVPPARAWAVAAVRDAGAVAKF
jgi:hypothetical protein